MTNKKDWNNLYGKTGHRGVKTYDRVGDVVPHNVRYFDMDFETIDAMDAINSQIKKLINYEVVRTGTHDMIAYYLEKASEYCNRMKSEAQERIDGK